MNRVSFAISVVLIHTKLMGSLLSLVISSVVASCRIDVMGSRFILVDLAID
jgi:hypothetical protein